MKCHYPDVICCVTTLFDVQHYPDDAELLNRNIRSYGWFKELFGAPPKGCPASTVYADSVKRAIGDDNNDDDFMTQGRFPPKPAPVIPKAKSGRSSKAVADENSDDDFTTPTRAPFRPKGSR